MSDNKEQPQRPTAGHRLKANVIEPTDATQQDAAAIQALARGEATPDQQRRGLDWIILFAAATYDMSFRPDGLGGERATAFAEGRRFVGNEIVRLTKTKVSKLKE
jgi:hypothetical protein